MAPKTRVKKKSMTAADVSAITRKKQRVSLESTESLPAGPDIAPTLTASSGGDETPAMDVASVAGSSSGLEGATSTSSSFGGEGASVAGPNASAGVGIADQLARTRATEEPGPSLASFPGPSGEEGSGGIATESTPRTAQDIQFAEDWLETLDKDDIISISFFLCCQLVHMFSFTETKAAVYAAAMVKRSDRTVRRWRSGLIDNDGVLPESQEGRYQQTGVLWYNEELNKKAVEYVRENAAVKGRPNLTTVEFCKWVNECLLRNSTLEPGFPRKVGLETSRQWLHHLGFEVLTVWKRIFIGGHERQDVIEARKLFLRKTTKIGFLHFTNATTEDAMKALPDVNSPTNERRSKTVVFFHDESTFMSNYTCSSSRVNYCVRW